MARLRQRLQEDQEPSLAAALPLRLGRMDMVALVVAHEEVGGMMEEGVVLCRPESGGEEMYHLEQEVEDIVEVAEGDQEAGNR
jgi:hypothetical protein